MQDQEGDGEPAHHARRPMNAFLIFCKRHRSVVRDKYPNLENRSITKILGEWWANLDKEEKACYTGLAKQYKDAFFNANPDFKWYKLPAPPLRTLTSRPREADKSPERDDMEMEKTNNNSTKLDFNKKDKLEEPKPLCMFTPGKLADEANMGSLSNLLATKTDTHSNPYYSPISSDYRSHNLLKVTSREDNIRELQNALTETTRVFEDLDEEKSMYQYSAGDQFTNQDVIDQIVDKRLKDEDYQRNSSDDERNAKSGRSCKGKRYQEFMAVGGLKVNKRPKREYNDKNDDDTASPRREPSSSRSEDSACDDPKPPHTDTMPETDKIDTTYDGRPEPDNNANRTFKASDFDLDAKIKALPPLSLEKFQQKKRDNKRKKKTINLKPKSLESSYIVNSVPRPFDRRMEAERWRATVIGSQKRKPRKISITRLEINSLVSRVEHEQSSPDMMIATEAPCTEAQCMEACSQPHAVDLFALATLAEVAANTSKLDDSRLAAGPSPV